MPILNDDMEDHRITGSNYGFSATRLGALGASEYTLAVIAADTSGSVVDFLPQIEGCIKQVVKACGYSPRADNLMLRLTRFDSLLEEVHGFKPLAECHVNDYDNCMRSGGATALFDAAHNAIESAAGYGKQLTLGGFGVNAIIFVITDGMDNSSTRSAKDVAAAIGRTAVDGPTRASSKGSVKVSNRHSAASGPVSPTRKASKKLAPERRHDRQTPDPAGRVDSLTTILVGVNVEDREVSKYLRKISKAVGFSSYIEISRANERSLAALAEFVTRSIAIQSMSLKASGRSLSF